LGTNPPGAAPDEPAHYLRALAVGRGDFLGEPVDSIPKAAAASPTQAAFLARSTRSVLAPAGLAVPLSWFCTIGSHDTSARCVTATTTNDRPIRQASDEAAYLPYLYIPSGLAMLPAGDATHALFLARLANAVITYGLLLAAILLLWEGISALSLLGLPVAVTPMVLFIGTAITPSGPEIAAAAAFVAFLLRVTRNAEAPAWAWALGIAAGAVLVLARPLGFVWMVAILLMVFSLAGRSALVGAARRMPRATALGAGVLLTTAVMSVAWELAVLPPQPHSLPELAGFLLPSLAAVPEALAQAIGIFGWVEVRMPAVMYAVWGVALILLVAPALLRGRLRERRTLDGLVVAVGAAIVVVSVFFEMPVGFWVQGRHVLPFFLALPLVAGEVLYRNRDRIGTSTVAGLAAATGTLAAIVQLTGWYTNAHRYAVGARGSWVFLGSAEWSPAGGWVLWFALAAGGSALLVAAAMSAVSDRRAEPTTKIQDGAY
jgi:hypothetical protein